MYVCTYVCMFVCMFVCLKETQHPLPRSAAIAVPAVLHVPDSLVALRHVPPAVSHAVSMLLRLLPGNGVVADVTISPLTISQTTAARAWRQRPKQQEPHDAGPPENRACGAR